MNNLDLEIMANKIRRGVLDSVHEAKCGHPGGALSAADIITYLYFEEMHVDPQNPQDPGRDRFVLSKGHSAPALYAALAYKGFFPVSELLTLRKLGSRLQGHPAMDKTPGVDMSTGSLGQGISAAVGMALAAKLSRQSWQTYTMLGDGELEEGQVWEAAMFAADKKLDNLTAIVDYNHLQIDGNIADVNTAEPIDAKFLAFGWNVISINGHDFDQIRGAFHRAKEVKEKPTVIIAETVKGKGISYMENVADWHGKAPGDDLYKVGASDLDRIDAELAAKKG